MDSFTSSLEEKKGGTRCVADHIMVYWFYFEREVDLTGDVAMSRQFPRLERDQAKRIEHKKAQLDQFRPLPEATSRRLNHDLCVFLTYHSNAIEGNSLSLQETQMVIEDGVTFQEHSQREHLEAINHAAAYQLVLSLAERREPLAQRVILTVHSLVMNHLLETRGQFRKTPVFIRGSNMTPPPAWEVQRLMHEWVAWIFGEGLSYELVTRAAIAHHGFEAVHGFEDGNGRVGRLLLDLMLMQEGYPPALLLVDWRSDYIEALMRANTGHYDHLLYLIGQAVEDGLDWYLQTVAL